MEFLNRAEGEDVWAVTRYTVPQRSAAVPTIRNQGEVAEAHGDKSKMLMDISFLLQRYIVSRQPSAAIGPQGCGAHPS